jgi:16S rRNA (adenine1518-N6/adenine1519-N6)-dimethyltransferase
VSPQSFWPAPKVESAVVTVRAHAGAQAGAATERIVQVAKMGFAQKRKTLANNLKHGLECEREQVESVLATAGLSPQARAQELTVEDWRRLCVVLHEHNMV